MAYTAHVDRGRELSGIRIADDRGLPSLEIDLPEVIVTPEQAEQYLNAHGWVVTAGWTTTDRGWEAPVAQAAHGQTE